MRIKRKRPSTEEDRKRAAELRGTIASSRTSKAEKEAAEAEYEVLCPPVIGSPSASSLEKQSILSDRSPFSSGVQVDRQTGALLSAAEIQDASRLDLKTASTEWLRLHQKQWSEVNLKCTVQRSALLQWRIDTLKGTETKSFADYWKPLEARFEEDMAFSARFKAASPEERNKMLDERYGITK